MAPHPYPPGTRVRHHGQQYPEAVAGTATVLEAKRQGDGSYEYRVLVDKGIAWSTAGRETRWASYHTYEAVPAMRVPVPAMATPAETGSGNALER